MKHMLQMTQKRTWKVYKIQVNFKTCYLQKSTNIISHKAMEPNYISFRSLKLAVNLIRNLQNLHNHL
jgi:hypothetical protein